MPLDRPKAAESLGGLVEPEPLPCHLISVNATVSFGDLADLNHSYTYRELGRVQPWQRHLIGSNKPLFANGFITAFASIFSLITITFIFVAFLNRQSFKPVQTVNYKLTEHGQILIRRLSAWFDFLLPSYYGVNQCLSTRLSFQLQVVSTRSSYNPETISPVWFDYKSPVLYMVNPVFITARHGFIINRHNMEGVISTQDWGYHLYYKKLVKPTM